MQHDVVFDVIHKEPAWRKGAVFFFDRSFAQEDVSRSSAARSR